jgi:hypothetical protein
MRLSAFLALSVPLAALAQLPALADTDSMADTGNWLKSSIATLKAGKPQTTKVSHAMPEQPPTAPKLRPFMVNRYLPHERDLMHPLAAQQGQMDPSAYMSSAASTLNGSVSASYSAPYMVPGQDRYASAMMPTAAPPQRAPKISNNAARSRVPRVMPGQAPVLPDQLTCKSTITPVIPDPPAARQTNAGQARPEFPISMPMSALPAPMNGTAANFGMQPAPFSTAADPPSISPQEQMLLERLMAQNKPTAIMGTNGEIYGLPEDNPVTGTGPSPYPTSLMSGNAVPGLGVSPMRRPAHVPRAAFGSWHQEKAALPECGFHSFVPYRQPRLYALSVGQPQSQRANKIPARRGTGKQATRAGTPRLMASAHSSSSTHHNATAPKHLASSQSNAAEAPKVALASYPTYVSHSGLAY